MLSFLARRCQWVTRIPFLPQSVDRLLRIQSGVVARDKLRATRALEDAACHSLGAIGGPHRFGGTGFFVGGRELGHVHGNALVDVFVGRKEREALVAEGMASPHYIFPKSGWVSFWMEKESDSERALELLRIARAVAETRSGK